ncbi:hypothetical protein MUP65_02525 [Patescibacteria group bacterium]|nr:hypothetical protein [Patescibacteria group bacterium]
MLSKSQNRAGELSEKEAFVYGFLNDESLHLNKLSRRTGLAVGEVAGLLTMMELKKIVVNMGGMKYRQNR